ncbi:unnamed protein product [Cylicostephanus goldi]|uniref:Uncharacterized protein n=1 Tax=Cylicostephanus goldi TaxID=71465 RepID=A0A3P6SCT6_CYLGO|nr:unnamed protein product [Cylicostephanus goldi]
MEHGQKPTLSIGSAAHEQLKAIVLKPEFQSDLTHTSPFGGTSWCANIASSSTPTTLFQAGQYVSVIRMHVNSTPERVTHGGDAWGKGRETDYHNQTEV